MKKHITRLLLLAMALSLTACGGENPNTPTTTDTAGSTESTAPVDPYLDDLPEDINLNGAEIRFLYREEVADEFYLDEATGDVVDDAIFASVRSVEERLNAKMVVTKMAGHYASARNGYKNHITNSIMAGDDLYDWVDMMSGSGAILQQNGVFKNLLNNKYIDLDKPYYIPGLVENLSITAGLYFLSGDASLGYMKTAFCLYFNKQIAEDFKVDNIYEIVDAGE
ncbi:MAG: hypothetical protein IJ493_02215 [Clostridia bacterium]|nr:hypothetical protein [Clostridia bacterium]